MMDNVTRIILVMLIRSRDDGIHEMVQLFMHVSVHVDGVFWCLSANFEGLCCCHTWRFVVACQLIDTALWCWSVNLVDVALGFVTENKHDVCSLL